MEEVHEALVIIFVRSVQFRVGFASAPQDKRFFVPGVFGAQPIITLVLAVSCKSGRTRFASVIAAFGQLRVSLCAYELHNRMYDALLSGRRIRLPKATFRRVEETCPT